MSSAPTARRGIFAGEIAFVLAIVATLVQRRTSPAEGYTLIAVALLIGAAIGVPLGLKVPMTAMPQRIALSHAFGALAAGLVGTAHYYLERDEPRASSRWRSSASRSSSVAWSSPAA